MVNNLRLEGIVEKCVYHRSKTISFNIGEQAFFVDCDEYSCIPLTNGLYIRGTAEKGDYIPKGILKIKEMEVLDKKAGTVIYSLTYDKFRRE